MHSLFYYNTTLSDSEISVLAQVSLSVHTQPDCRCPPSHPIARETTCLDATGTSQVPRVNNNTHHVSLLNDDDFTTWWQSEAGIAPVNVTISLDGLRAALLVAINFRSIQPETMVLYYSNDGGVTFTPRQYYSSDCSRFGLPDNSLLRTATDVSCITSVGGIFRVLDVGNRPEADLYLDSPNLQAFSLATHIRLELLDWNSEVLDEQYFAIAEVLVGGQECVCNGHADACMGSLCICQHNTTGSQCDQCLPLFNNEPWAPGTTSSANQCEMCECNNHSDNCLYDEATSTGLCVNCTGNTLGPQCEMCVPYFYHSQGVPLDSPSSCLSCDCNTAGVRNDGNCEKAGPIAGQCDCKMFVTGRQCDMCQAGYYNLSSLNAEGCTSCDCDVLGTVGGSTACDSLSGQCLCKSNVVDRNCSSCASGHYGVDTEEGCLPCDQQCDQCSGPGPSNCVVSGSNYRNTNCEQIC